MNIEGDPHMDEQPFWKAKTSFFCYLLLVAGILIGSLVLAAIILGMGVDPLELSFPSAIISLPINEGIILTITLLFAKQNGANLKKLGWKKPSFKTLVIVSLGALLLIVIATGASIVEELVLGPDPDAEFILEAILPKDTFQLIALIGISLALVGPAEELAFRGFVQRGFETSFGKTLGLLISSVLFGLLHGLNSIRAILPVTILSLFLGYVWQKTNNNTIATAWMHGLYDAITISLAYLAFL